MCELHLEHGCPDAILSACSICLTTLQTFISTFQASEITTAIYCSLAHIRDVIVLVSLPKNEIVQKTPKNLVAPGYSLMKSHELAAFALQTPDA